MKRIKASAIFQTVAFLQKPEYGYTVDEALSLNRKEAERYIHKLDRLKIRYRITKREEQADGSVVLWVRKQHSERIDSEEYFNL